MDSAQDEGGPSLAPVAVVAGGAALLLGALLLNRKAGAVSTTTATAGEPGQIGAGYINGKAAPIRLASIGGGLSMRADAAAAFARMAEAARAAGHVLSPTRAFATMQQQRVLRAKYLGALAKKKGAKVAALRAEVDKLAQGLATSDAQQLRAAFSEGGGNLAARPGFSNHQGGIAVDVAVGSVTSAVYLWLKAHARNHGFRETVKGEPWHWEYRP